MPVPSPEPVDPAGPSAPASAEPAAGAPSPRTRLGAPARVWAIGAAAAALHLVPFLRIRLTAPAEGMAWIGTSQLPKDWLAYIALVREQPVPGQLFLANPFTTDLQDGRFILLLFHALNWVRRITGLDGATLLEIARTALVLVLAVTLWRFLADVVRSERARTWAVALALLGGGLGTIARAATDWLPASVGPAARQELWPRYGWTTFQSLYNPLWAAGLVLLLVSLGPVLRPGGPRSTREIVQTGVALLVLAFTHPYSALAFVAIVAGALATEWLAEGTLGRARTLRIAAAAVPALAVAGAVALWQTQDDVYRLTSGGVLGKTAVPVFWYPVTFAAAGALAAIGWLRRVEARDPWRHALTGWAIAIALLHSSTILNGYHFLMYAFLPVAILAAEPAARAFAGFGAAPRARAAGLALLGVLLFCGAAVDAAWALRETDEFQIPRDGMEAVQALAKLPPGNVLCDAYVGNVVPAYGPHRVFVGQWFMTPDHDARARLVQQAFSPGGAMGARWLVESGRIDYVVAPTPAVPELAAALAPLAPRVEAHGVLSILALRGR